MSDPPNPYRQTTGAPTSPPVLPPMSVQEQTTHTLIETPGGTVQIGRTKNRIVVDNATGDRIVETTTSQATTLDGRSLNGKHAVACGNCQRAPFIEEELGKCSACDNTMCRKHCLTKHGDRSYCNRPWCLITRGWTWLTTR